MSNAFKGQVFITGCLLVGSCLAYPVILADYFYEKPQIDFVVHAVIFIASFYVIWKNLTGSRWVKNLAFVLLLLPLAWLKLEFGLYSELNSPQFVTYTLLIILSAAMASILRFESFSKEKKWTGLLAIPIVIAGFVISFFSREGGFVGLFVLFFALGLTAQYWEKAKVKASTITLVALGLIILGQSFQSQQFLEQQSKYHDKLVFSRETDMQRIDVTEWRGNHWFYTDGINQFSSIDSWLFYEPFVYPALRIASNKEKVLVIGGENGMLVNELRRAGIEDVQIIPVDEELFNMAQNETLLTRYNGNSLSGDEIQRIDSEVFTFISRNIDVYDIIFIDVADPVDLERNQYFTKEFYQLLGGALNDDGLFITQSGSPYFATEAFEVVQKTIEASGFDPVTFHNQILTLGEWSWTMARKNKTSQFLKSNLFAAEFNEYQTQWLNQEAMQMMLSFGKPTRVTSDLQVNTIIEPTLYKYYLNGNYALK
ncbi:hypothetical protein BFP97_12920 [Roseivirga sp. 4D4]|uniref:spermine/spermidine synthase domain-containing protein n=1 Tax=Roseivirga sp. 4D4 TaxID=1889784 RepID=UPI000852E80A|nr:hypothetical protein [Roseivirga sp. 4D4]OEK02369.1 hypothetical protein BFP97_12920 [Roseivirga sp. 4D4]